MLAALDRYVGKLEAGGVREELNSSVPSASEASPLITLIMWVLLAVVFLGELFVVSLPPLGSDEFSFNLHFYLNVYLLACLPVLFFVVLLLKRHRKGHPDSPLWRLERARALKLWAFALWFWIAGFRWLIPLVLALWVSRWLALQVGPAAAELFGGADLKMTQDALGRVCTVFLLYLLVWLTRVWITRRLAQPETA